jgi:hypothetical protein
MYREIETTVRSLKVGDEVRYDGRWYPVVEIVPVLLTLVNTGRELRNEPGAGAVFGVKLKGCESIVLVVRDADVTIVKARVEVS